MERNRDNFLVRLDFTSDPPKAASHLHSPSTWVLVPKQRPPAKRPSPLGEAHFVKGFYQRTAGPSKLTNWDVVLGWFVWTDANGILYLKKTWYHNIYIIYSMHSYDILFERYPGVISFKTGTASFAGAGSASYSWCIFSLWWPEHTRILKPNMAAPTRNT